MPISLQTSKSGSWRTEMTVFELLATSAWNDWTSRGDETHIGLFSSAEKAESKIKEIKKNEEWKMSWSPFRVNAVKVQ
jgi:hypothetical protein